MENSPISEMTVLFKRQLFILVVVTLLSFGTILLLFTSSNLHAHHAEKQSSRPSIAVGSAARYERAPIEKCTHLVIVPGHAIQRCSSWRELQTPACWTLLPYQVNQTQDFISHLRVGIEVAAKDPNALLVLSGGQTREAAGPYSESSSLLRMAELADWFSLGGSVSGRCVTEDFARDSLQNVLFSMCRFWQVTGRWPAKTTVVGFPFKRERFVDVHWPACHIEDAEKSIGFEYASVGDPTAIDDALPLFKDDPAGCKSPLLDKRRLRNPYSQQHSYQRCPHPLMKTCHQEV